MSLPSASGYSISRPLGGVLSSSRLTDLGMCTIHIDQFKRPTTSNTAQVFACTPDLFPRLAHIAKCWAKWRVLRFEVIYLPSCSLSTNGTVEMAFLYSYKDAIPTSTNGMSACSGFTTASVWAGSDGAKLLSSSGPVTGNAVVAKMDCKPTWYNYTSARPESSEAAALTDTYIPARLVVRSNLLVASEDSPGDIYARVHFQVMDPVNPESNL